MKPENFCYWLQGYLELTKEEDLTEDQVKIIKNHLNLVFEHVIDPSYVKHLAPLDNKKVGQILQEIHDKGSTRPPTDSNISYRC